MRLHHILALAALLGLTASSSLTGQEPTSYHQFPKPHGSAAGINHHDRGENKPANIADKWKPRDAQEPGVATLSRFAGRLIDRTNGKAYSANELVTNSTVNAAIATNTAASRLALELNGVVVSKADGTRKGYAPSANTDTARGLALEVAFAAAVAGDTIDLSPGSYYVAKTTSSIAGITGQFAILDRMTVRLNGARLFKKSTDTASAMFVISASSGIDDWGITGPGVLEGSLYATSDTAARGTDAAEIGIEVRACRRGRVEKVSIMNFAGSGIEANTATFASDEYTSGSKNSTMHIEGCNIDRNNIGYAVYAGNEYHTITNTTFSINNTGCDIYAGNTKFVGCDAIKNNNHAFRIRRVAVANDGHGCWTGGHITHNLGYAVYQEAGQVDNLGNVVSYGFLFNGVTFGADSTTTNKIESRGGGLNLSGCYVQTPFFAASTPTGMNMMSNCFIAGTVGAADDLTSISDLSAGERAKWQFLDNYTLQGSWKHNDTATLYAALAADQVSADLDTTMRDVTGLTLTLTPGTYQLTGSCLVTPASSTSGVKIGVEWTGTGTMSGNNIAYQNTNVLTNGVSYFGDGSLASIVKTVNAGVNGQPMQVKIDLVVVVTATATARFQFGKQSAVATNLTVESGSYLLAERIAP